LTETDKAGWIIPAGLMGMILAGCTTYALPDWAVFSSPFRQAYSCRFAGVARLCYFSMVLMALAAIRPITAGHSTFYPLLLWFIPLVSSFPFFMLLRDVYQHSNADTGRLTNSRVFYTDPFTRWAVFVYGQDMHIPHHLFPAIPHYRLGELHRILKQASVEYDSRVVECHGTFNDPLGRVTILDEMTRPHPAVS
jgi:fatty acid desaturase